MKAAAKFTRDRPVTKVELYNCFYGGGAYTHRTLVEAKIEIGDNAPKYLIREGYMTHVMRDGVDWFQLTTEGKAWLQAGTRRYLELHPERAGEVRFVADSAVIRRPQAPARTPQNAPMRGPIRRSRP